MKSASQFLIALVALFTFVNGFSQSSANKKSGLTTAPGTSVVLSLKNLSNNQVTIFAGPKNELETDNARQKVYAAHSTNTIYTSLNEVVCIVADNQKAVSCIHVMPTAKALEVDNTGSIITIK